MSNYNIACVIVLLTVGSIYLFDVGTVQYSDWRNHIPKDNLSGKIALSLFGIILYTLGVLKLLGRI